MIVTGYSSGMVECCWYDGFGANGEAFHENELVLGKCCYQVIPEFSGIP